MQVSHVLLFCIISREFIIILVKWNSCFHKHTGYFQSFDILKCNLISMFEIYATMILLSLALSRSKGNHLSTARKKWNAKLTQLIWHGCFRLIISKSHKQTSDMKKNHQVAFWSIQINCNADPYKYVSNYIVQRLFFAIENKIADLMYDINRGDILDSYHCYKLQFITGKQIYPCIVIVIKCTYGTLAKLSMQCKKILSWRLRNKNYDAVT